MRDLDLQPLRDSRKMPILGAGIAQLVERNLAKVEVAGSNPVSRSNASVIHKRMSFRPYDERGSPATQGFPECFRLATSRSPASPERVALRTFRHGKGRIASADLTNSEQSHPEP